MDPTQAGLALQHKRDLERIQKLEHRLQAHRLNLQNAQDKIQWLTAQLSEMLHEVSDLNPSQSLSDRIYYGLVKNQGGHLNERRNSLETLIWAQEIHAISPAVLDLI
jgi:chromosome segregation ATPase